MRTLLSTLLLIPTIVLINACSSTKKAVVKNTEPISATKGIVLNNGQKITALSSSTTDTDMGMGMGMKNVTTTTNILHVVAANDQQYSISNTAAKLKLSIDMMGQSQSYDSENPEDKNSELGKELSKKINTSDTLFVDKINGEVIKNKKNESPERAAPGDDEANPFAGMMGAMDGSTGDIVVEGAFFTAAKDRKAGDSWTDSTSDKTAKRVKTYTIKSIENNIATILINARINGSGETEMQGTNVSFTMNTTSIGEMMVDIKTSLVSKISSEANITGNMEVMGQSMPITSKAVTSVVYQY